MDENKAKRLDDMEAKLLEIEAQLIEGLAKRKALMEAYKEAGLLEGFKSPEFWGGVDGTEIHLRVLRLRETDVASAIAHRQQYEGLLSKLVARDFEFLTLYAENIEANKRIAAALEKLAGKP